VCFRKVEHFFEVLLVEQHCSQKLLNVPAPKDCNKLYFCYSVALTFIPVAQACLERGVHSSIHGQEDRF
jgi:hypothetical protein